MLFDKLCGAAEKLKEAFPTLYDIVDGSRLFIFPYVPQDVLPKEGRTIPEDFHLPFPIVAVEDKASCVVVCDMEEGAFGPTCKRIFIEINDISYDFDLFRGTHSKEDEDIKKEALDLGWRYCVTMGSISNIVNGECGNGYTVTGGVGSAFLFNEDGTIEIIKTPKDQGSIYYRSTAGNYVTCLEEIARFSAKDRFILESSPVRVKSCKDKIVRSQFRPTYTVLKPDEIRKRMGLPDIHTSTDRLSPRPHERRGHYRVYSSDRFVNAKGKRQWIDSIWIGPSESISGGKKYRVLLKQERE